MRKFKLITTIACLALVVTFFVYGVYAATQVSYSFTSSIKYKVVDVFLNITYGIEGDASSQNTLTTKNATTGLFQPLSTSPYPLTDGGIELQEGTPTVVFVKVQNLHDMDINIKFSHDWENVAQGQENYVSHKSVLYNNGTDGTSETNTNVTENNVYVIPAKNFVTYKLTLAVVDDYKNYKFTGVDLSINMESGLISQTN